MAQTGFIENKGQFHPQVNYEVDFHTQKIYLDKEGFTVLLHNNAKWVEWVEEYHEHRTHKRKFFFF